MRIRYYLDNLFLDFIVIRKYSSVSFSHIMAIDTSNGTYYSDFSKEIYGRGNRGEYILNSI